MYKPHYGFCKCHNQWRLLPVKSLFCAFGNEALKKAKKKAEGKKVKDYKYQRKKTGESDVFHVVLSEIPLDDYTKCFVCDKRISLITHNNFAHALPKGKYELFRLHSPNIKILCYNLQGTGCHSKWDFDPKSTLTDDNWKKMFELEAQLKKEYKELKETERKIQHYNRFTSLTEMDDEYNDLQV